MTHHVHVFRPYTLIDYGGRTRKFQGHIDKVHDGGVVTFHGYECLCGEQGYGVPA